MIFIPNGIHMAFSLMPIAIGNFTVFLTEGDIYLVIEYKNAERDLFTSDLRSTILHPTHGLCKTYVSLDRGKILQ